MLDELKCKEKFIKYVSLFDMDNRLISLKFEHTFRVAEVSKDIAKSLGLDEEQIKLAYIIGIDVAAEGFSSIATDSASCASSIFF